MFATKIQWNQLQLRSAGKSAISVNLFPARERGEQSLTSSLIKYRSLSRLETPSPSFPEAHEGNSVRLFLTGSDL